MSPDNTTQCMKALQFDGDIAGLGVRLSFYLQNFILVWLVDRSSEESEGALWTFIATSFGLTVAALVQVPGHQLSLLEGILVSQLSWLANLGTILALASYSRSKGKDNLVKFAAVIQGYLSMILTIVLWTYAETFNGGNCTEDIKVKFVFMYGVSVPAIGSGRPIALAFSSVMLLLYSIVTYTECSAWIKTGKSRLPSKKEGGNEHQVLELPTVVEPVQRLRGGSSNHGRHIASIPRPHRKSSHGQRSLSRQPWLGTNVDPISPGILIAQLLVFSYFIATTELMVNQKHAHVSDTNQWGFGQVLALTVVIPPAISLLSALNKNRMAKLSKKERSTGSKSRSRQRSGTSSSNHYRTTHHHRHASGDQLLHPTFIPASSSSISHAATLAPPSTASSTGGARKPGVQTPLSENHSLQTSIAGSSSTLAIV
ncbi:hypothetical protein M422DRAFT_26551 [Sphaerobolus stellatus SS14]|nr:hypothetical protein M422DRAFT_26551 [Sphaerobolus stellatus SS14]